MSIKISKIERRMIRHERNFIYSNNRIRFFMWKARVYYRVPKVFFL